MHWLVQNSEMHTTQLGSMDLCWMGNVIFKTDRVDVFSGTLQWIAYNSIWFNKLELVGYAKINWSRDTKQWIACYSIGFDGLQWIASVVDLFVDTEYNIKAGQVFITYCVLYHNIPTLHTTELNKQLPSLGTSCIVGPCCLTNDCNTLVQLDTGSPTR